MLYQLHIEDVATGETELVAQVEAGDGGEEQARKQLGHAMVSNAHRLGEGQQWLVVDEKDSRFWWAKNYEAGESIQKLPK